MFSAQYLVNCLEEDHVCHGITNQEPRSRPMKETLHSRHHSAVLPRLGASRKETLQNLHTRVRFCYTAPRQQQSTEGTPYSVRRAETEPKATMHYLPVTISTPPFTAGLQT